MIAWQAPFFWALISMFGLVGACAVVGSERIGRVTGWGVVFVALFDLGRCLLPLCDQPRIAAGAGFDLAGAALLILGGYFGLAPCFMIRPLNVADGQTSLITTGFYQFVRNPIYLGELLWCLGWAMLNHALIGIALVPLWWAGLLILILIEEEALERALGEPYRVYKQQVRGRILPGLPV